MTARHGADRRGNDAGSSSRARWSEAIGEFVRTKSRRRTCQRYRFSESEAVSARGILLGIGAIFWISAGVCWYRAKGTGRLLREAGLFAAAGIPFLVAGFFHSSSSYPPETAVVAPPPALAETRGPAPDLGPTPSSRAPRSYAEAVAASQVAAVARYPDLGKAGSRFNTRFIAAYRRLRVDEPAVFADPDWPLRLAERLARGESGAR